MFLILHPVPFNDLPEDSQEQKQEAQALVGVSTDVGHFPNILIAPHH